MDRLTIRNTDGTVSQPTQTTIEEVFYKLAAYEDTGMTPEEIERMKHDYFDVVVERDRLKGANK